MNSRSIRLHLWAGAGAALAAVLGASSVAHASAAQRNTFQAIDGTTVYVLGSDGKLWREVGSGHGPNPVDANVQAFQAIDDTTVYVLGQDGNLWRETGDLTHRTWVDGNVLRFQAFASGEVLVLGEDANLWREQGSMANRSLVDANVRAFHAIASSNPTTEIVYVIGSDGQLWREHGTWATRDWVDAGVTDFQEVPGSTSDVDVLGADGNLWHESGNMNSRTWIDGDVRAFQDVGGSEVYVLGYNGNLWDEHASAYHRTQVDGSATMFQAMGPVAPGMAYVLGADGKLWREQGSGHGANPVDANVASSRVMANPQVVMIFWGRDYSVNPALQQQTRQLFDAIVSGPYMDQMGQYGVGRGAVVSQVWVDAQIPPAGTRPPVSWVDLQNELMGWIQNGTVRPPSVNETNVLYFIIPPPENELYLGSDPTKPSLGIQGLHWHEKFNPQSTQDDVLIGVAKTYNPSDVSKFVQTSDIWGHEMIEVFNDPLGGRLELEDICDGQDNGPGVPEFLYENQWYLEQYWSVQNNACTEGSM